MMFRFTRYCFVTALLWMVSVFHERNVLNEKQEEKKKG